jgi:NAD(P)-dependent dehydrogenase (short-subunit alcohol dehydrogenase family)
MLDLDLSGRLAVVSGSTEGIGFATAAQLSRQRARVVLTGRRPRGVEDALRRLRQAVPGAEAEGISADLGAAEGVRRLLDRVPRADVLVNNLGIYEQKPFLDIPDEDWQRFFEVNVLSAVRLTRAYLPGMLDGRWGRVVFVSSESGLHIPPEMVHYGFTKAALLAIMRGVAEGVPGSGVTVNAVLPGPTRAAGVDAWLAETAAREGISVEEAGRRFVAENRPTSLIRRVAAPEEAANLIGYLCSPAASATTGAGMRVDGGIVRAVL